MPNVILLSVILLSVILLSVIFLNVVLLSVICWLSVILPSAIFSECHFAECNFSECHFAECHFAECHFAEFAECCLCWVSHFYCSSECCHTECHGALRYACIIEQVALNKSNLQLKIILQNTQTLQLFKKIIKTESIYKRNQNPKLNGSGSETKWSN